MSFTMKSKMVAPPPPPQWVIDLSSPPVKPKDNLKIVDPPGFSSAAGGKVSLVPLPAISPSPPPFHPYSICKLTLTPFQKNVAKIPRKAPTQAETDTLKIKKAWEVALAPFKQLPMTAFMMYMSGNGLQIFSIMMVVMAFKNPIMGMIATNSAFQRFESPGTVNQLWWIKVVYMWMQVLALGLGVWKVNQMGLLP